MVFMTTWALIVNEGNFVTTKNGLLMVVNGLVIIVMLWLVVEGLMALFGKREEARTEA
jgi:tetrahydromethanopterin S-methyltransferase subunit E